MKKNIYLILIFFFFGGSINLSAKSKKTSDFNFNKLRTSTCLFQNNIDINVFGVTGDGINDDSRAFQIAVSSLNEKGGGVLNLKKGATYLIGNIVLSSNIRLIGNGATIKAKDIYYTTITKSYNKDSKVINVADASGIRVGDVLTVKGVVTDILLVKAKKGNTLVIEPFRLMYGKSERYIGLKWNQPKGATVGVRSQIFWITSGLDLQADLHDIYPNKDGVNNVLIEDVTFIGSRNSNIFENYNVYDLVSSGAIMFYRTKNCTVKNCKFYGFFSTPTVVYGWSTGFEFMNNFVNTVGYVLPNSVPVDERDSSSGITLHWDQRFTNSDPELIKHVSMNYKILDNLFLDCWNGGIFVSASNTGIISNNIIDGFVSKGISVYGGDLGISTYNISIHGNTIKNGIGTNNNNNLGTGLWISIAETSIDIKDNLIENCDKGIIIQKAADIKTTRNIVRNCRENIIKIF